MYVEIHVPPNSWFWLFELLIDIEYIMNITLSL